MNLVPDWAPNIHPLLVHFPIAFLFGWMMFFAYAAGATAHCIYHGNHKIIVADYAQREVARFTINNPLADGVDYWRRPHRDYPHEINFMLGKICAAFDLIPFEIHGDS